MGKLKKDDEIEGSGSHRNIHRVVKGCFVKIAARPPGGHCLNSAPLRWSQSLGAVDSGVRPSLVLICFETFPSSAVLYMLFAF